MTKLSPSQQEAFDHLLEALPIGSVFSLWSGNGMGKTTILQELHRKRGGEFLDMKQVVDAMRDENPFQFEEVFEKILMDAMKRDDLVIVDDLDLLYSVICGCGYLESYPRAKFIEAPLTTVAQYAIAHGKKLVFGNEGKTPAALKYRSFYSGIQKFTVEDYEFLCKEFLGNKSKKLDHKKIFRFAPKLNAHQMKSACLWHEDKPLDTDIFVEYLRNQRMASNVDLTEVEAVDLRSLKGLNDVIESLEANIIVPLEQDELAAEFNIKPKRGVLLAGPPGTGKTTVGRALAHRLKSKFFLIDGTFISGSREFYAQIQQVFEAAKNNAPSIIFIDDSDVIFEDKDDFGLYRYLLTMLDGLESESNKRICVMMTTMDVSSVPPALVRSGRIELWLETRLPDRDARLEILSDLVAGLPPMMRKIDVGSIADETEDLTGADLRRLMEDVKILYAYDKSRKLPIKDLKEYVSKATETIRTNKEKYASAERMSHSKKSGLQAELAEVMRAVGSGAFSAPGAGGD